MENTNLYFDIASESDELYLMYHNWDRGFLSLVVLPEKYVLSGNQLDHDYIFSLVGNTTSSMFCTNRYKRLRITPKLFVRGRRRRN